MGRGISAIIIINIIITGIHYGVYTTHYRARA